ncbi:unnamed protein product [Hymenolepis diminuta]|uniref:Protein kinase domain-containing protein n=1 Tax=Hymenolepis diminuta TaxID=6216 RepID=A0A0R3STN5_HYMDI|nr:unnamed protein product [Hymenolepis diminuta]
MEQTNLSKPDKDPEDYIKNVGEFRYEPSAERFVDTLKRTYKKRKERELWKKHYGFPTGIQINLASCDRREIPGRGVNESKVENGARSDATEENPAGREKGEKKRICC